ncbi:XTP/dITP diphosphatase [Culicoidibacter larvae]|uniref:dITP/XTP pyrophosphatase n=1 Tax=Culicoidibacter larvae TaxID=2579976 RepID=A0A5R8Q8Z4_9FIRM|nr:XTP/dITP diphosphatase [Culicoidibacter larvae]TLG71763.1 XTP/dITP diphosphatase [Culicoidibacter larvae]
MQTILLASNNKNKIREFKAMFAPLAIDIKSLDDVGIDVDVEETADTFIGNARLKVDEISKLTDLPVLADDSGLCVNALDGAPGVFSARYAGVAHDDVANNEKLLAEMKGVVDRSAYFIAILILKMPDGRELVAQGRCDGFITDEPIGTNGFGYNPVFYMPYFNQTLAQVSDETKNAVSHRKHALEDLIEQVKQLGI